GAYNIRCIFITKEKKMSKEHGVQYFPITLFASVMGFAGLTIASKHAENIFAWSSWLWVLLLSVTSMLFIINGGILIYRLISFPSLVRSDLDQSSRIDSSVSVAISFLVLAVSYFEIYQHFPFILWCFGALLRISLTLTIISNLIF